MLRKIAAALLGSTAALAAAAVPGIAADDGGTDAMIVITSTGDLAISGPDDTSRRQIGADRAYSADAGTVAWPTTPGVDAASAITSVSALADHSGQLGAVSVADNRSGVLPSWTATVDWTDFALDGGDGSADQVIAATQIRYLSGPSTVSPTSSLGVFLPSLVPVVDGGQAARFSGLGLIGSGTTTWNPTIFADIVGEIPGQYHGTVTHSVTAG